MKYEFDLPDEDQQEYLADTLWAAAETKASYQSLLAQTDELPNHPQFIELFGDPRDNPKRYQINTSGLHQCYDRCNSKPQKASYYGGSIPWVKTGEIEQGYIYTTEESITEAAVAMTNCSGSAQINTIVAVMYGQGKHGVNPSFYLHQQQQIKASAAILPCENLNPLFLHQFFINEYDHLRDLGRGAQQANLNLSMIKNYPIMDVAIKDQRNLFCIICRTE